MVNNRLKRHKRIRSKISGNAESPRVAVFRSNKHMQVQLIDDKAHKTLVGMSTKALGLKEATKTDEAKELGARFAKEISKIKEVKKIVFDRGGYQYHGRVKALAESLRENGVKF